MVALAARPASRSGRRVRYINRVSDLLFVAARYANDNGNPTCYGSRVRTASEGFRGCRVHPLHDANR